jgi:hypothetical protein
VASRARFKHVPDKAKRPGLEILLGQQRFEHVQAVDGKAQIVPGREAQVAAGDTQTGTCSACSV